MSNYKTFTTAILILSALTISSVAGASPGSNSILPNLEKTSPTIQIVDKGAAINARAAEGKLKAAFNKLRKNEDFLAALKKKDIESLKKMLAAESGVSAPLSIKISGNDKGENSNQRFQITIRCSYPPLKCEIEIKL